MRTIYRTLLTPLALLATSALPATAQGDFLFDIDFAASSFDWGGTTSLGPMVTSPDTFNLQGTVQLLLSSGGNPVGSGQFTGQGDAAVVPDLHAEILAPWPLPPWAVIDITNVHFVLASDPFSVDGAGNFTATGVILIATAGTITIDPIAGSTINLDITGLSSDPVVATGSIVEGSGTLSMVAPVDVNFFIADPSTGLSADLYLLGTAAADYGCPAPTIYCQTSPNSAGPGAVISSLGSTSISQNELILQCDLLTQNQFAIFYYGPNQIQQPFGDGFRCVGGSVLRLPPQPTGNGTITHALDQTNLPGGGGIEPAEVVNFQCWYRDPAAGMSGFNFSDALSVSFCP
jgi:hypothetical protein